MAMIIDNLRIDHGVTVIKGFTDANGISLDAGESFILRQLSWDKRAMEIHLSIERPSGHVDLVFALAAKDGPRNGHMRDYFEVGEDVSAPRPFPAFGAHIEQPTVAPYEDSPTRDDTAWAQAANGTDGPDRLEAIEEEMRAAIPHIGAAASIAEMYANRMRAFRRAGNEVRAVAAFKLAVDWMATYASWATSGGEGAALSYERDQFHAALIREFGYDPAAGKS